MELATARYTDKESTKCFSYINRLFSKCTQNEAEQKACEQLLIRCECITKDTSTSSIQIYKPLNDLGQFLTRLRKKQIELARQQPNHLTQTPNSSSSCQAEKTSKTTTSSSTTTTTTSTSSKKKAKLSKIETEVVTSTQQSELEAHTSTGEQDTEAAVDEDGKEEEQEVTLSKKDQIALERIEKLDKRLIVQWNLYLNRNF